MGDVFDAFDLLETMKNLPRSAAAAVTEVAERVGLETFPEIWAIVQKNAEGKWELVQVALDRALLPDPEPQAFLLSSRLGKPRV